MILFGQSCEELNYLAHIDSYPTLKQKYVLELSKARITYVYVTLIPKPVQSNLEMEHFTYSAILIIFSIKLLYQLRKAM